MSDARSHSPAPPWEKLSQLLNTAEGLEIARLLAYANLLKETEKGSPQVRDPAPSSLPPGQRGNGQPRPIGPWLPESDGEELVFVREPFKAEDDVWWAPISLRSLLQPKSDNDRQVRVCLVGESAAAGMFYTPHFSPAIALDRHLTGQLGEGNAEVIDLTRSALNAEELVDVAAAALQLKPDYLVLFAGNNWFAGKGWRWEGPVEDKVEYSLSVTRDGVAGIIRTFQERVRRSARQTIQSIVAEADGSGTKLIFLVPAVNPLWERQEPLVWLGDGRSKDWFQQFAIAVDALDAGEFDKALSAGQRLLELDGGICPTSHRIVGKALLGLERHEEAAREFAAELDHANCFDQLCQTVPGTPLHLREAILAEAEKLGLSCVDMSSLFADHTGSPVLWDEMFVDYCHLSPAGMKVAMAPVAAQIVQEQTEAQDQRVTWKELAASDSFETVTPYVDGVARFYSTVYTSHVMSVVSNLDDNAYLVSRFQAAADASADILTSMTEYLKSRNGVLSSYPMLSASAQRIIGLSNSPFLDYAIVRSTAGVDAATVAAIAEVLDRMGSAGQETLTDYQESYKRRLRNSVDLTEPIYLERRGTAVAPLLKFDTEKETRRALPFFRAFWPKSAFTLVTDGEQELQLTITCRLPRIQRERTGQVRVLVNGRPAGELTATHQWSQHTMKIDAVDLQDGFNRLMLDWPPLTDEDDFAIDRAETRFRVSQQPDVFPIFGEVFSCVVRPANGECR